MHDWNSDWPYFGDVGEAAEYLGDFCKRWGRFRGQTKEKYGTVRFYATPNGIRSLLEITHPGYCSYIPAGYPKWLISFDIFVIGHILTSKWLAPLQYLVYKYRCFIYKLAYKNAIKKWPHIRSEILSGAHALELLDNCDDIKLNWNPPSFSEKDKKRIGEHVINHIIEQNKQISNLKPYAALAKDLKDEGRLNDEEIEYLGLFDEVD